MPVMNEDLIEERRRQVARLKHEGVNYVGNGGTISEIIKAALVAELERTRGNRTYAARNLGVSIRTIRNWIRLYGLK